MAAKDEQLLEQIDANIAHLVGINKKGHTLSSHLSELPTIAKGIHKLETVFLNTMKAAFGLQEKALARGANLEKMMSHNSNIVGDFSKNLTGYTQALGNEFELWSAGLRGNSKGMSTLALQAKITTGQNRQLISQMAKNTAGLGFNEQQASNLGFTVLEMSQRFGITGEKLSGALGKLGDQMKVFGALGIGPEIADAAARLDAGLGPALAGLSSELLATFTDGGKMVEAALLGVSRERQALLTAEGANFKNASQVLWKASEANEKNIEAWTQGSVDNAFALKAYAGVFGKHTLDLQKWREQMDQQATLLGYTTTEGYIEMLGRQEDINKEFQNTWANFWNKVVSPLQEAFTKFANHVLKFLSNPWVLPLIKALVGLTIAFAGLILLTKAIRKLITTIAAGRKLFTRPELQGPLQPGQGPLRGASPFQLKIKSWLQGWRDDLKAAFGGLGKALGGMATGLQKGFTMMVDGISSLSVRVMNKIPKIMEGLGKIGTGIGRLSGTFVDSMAKLGTRISHELGKVGAGAKWMWGKLSIWKAMMKKKDLIGPPIPGKAKWGATLLKYLKLALLPLGWLLKGIAIVLGTVLSPLWIIAAAIIGIIAVLVIFRKKIGKWASDVANAIGAWWRANMPSFLGGGEKEKTAPYQVGGNEMNPDRNKSPRFNPLQKVQVGLAGVVSGQQEQESANLKEIARLEELRNVKTSDPERHAQQLDRQIEHLKQLNQSLIEGNEERRQANELGEAQLGVMQETSQNTKKSVSEEMGTARLNK